MTVKYLPPMNYGGASYGDSLLMEALAEGPEFGRSSYKSTRWHLIRSAVSRYSEFDDDIRTVYHWWCGTFGHGFRTYLTDTVSDGEPLCGTCFGRKAGYDKEQEALIFSPRVNPPTMCPGSQKRWYDEVGRNIGRCWVCNEFVKARGFGGPYNWDYGLQRHPPGPGLVPGCEFHGWKQLTVANDAHGKRTVACRCKCVVKEAS